MRAFVCLVCLVVAACAAPGGDPDRAEVPGVDSAQAGPEAHAGWDVVVEGVPDSVPVRLAGTVAYMDLEGGLWVIRSANGTNYDPTNLPEAYRREGLRIEAEVRHRDDMASIGMVGPIIEIVRIRAAAHAPDGEASPSGAP